MAKHNPFYLFEDLPETLSPPPVPSPEDETSDDIELVDQTESTDTDEDSDGDPSTWMDKALNGRGLHMMGCPHCRENGIKSIVKNCRLNDREYTIICEHPSCSFQLHRFGEPSLNPEDMEKFGLPVDLLQQMSVNCEDVDKIIRLAAYEHVKSSNFSVADVQRFAERIRTTPFLSKDVDIEEVETTMTSLLIALEEGVKDISPFYRVKIKQYFGRIEGFSFPEDVFKME